jgi:uncharacterized protein YndB with AHSA1/START domain
MKKMKISAALAAIVLALSPTPAKTEVADSSANGFTVKAAVTINATPDDVYHRLIHNVGDWWDPAHSFSGDSHNLSIAEKPMGCFCEKLPNGGSVRHMEVVFLAPGKRLGMTGALGPLQSIAAAGNMTIQLSSAAGGTKVEVTYAVTGYTPKGMNTWAAPVDSVLTQQFTRLKAHVEGGEKALKPQSPK